MITRLRSWWKKRVKPLEITGLILLLVGLLAFIIIIILGYIFNWDWTGLVPYTPPHPYESSFQRGKTLWDWMQLLIIPAVIAGAGYLINLTTTRNEQKSTQLRDQTEREIASDNQREDALLQYIDKMSELLLDKKLRESQTQQDEVRKIARVRTLTVLPRLDAKRKGSVLQFLYESGLIKRGKAIIDLNASDLRGATMHEVNLSKADLHGATLSKADLSWDDLSEADLNGAYLVGANLNQSDLSGADLSGADLSGAQVTSEQLDKSKSLLHTTMPDGTIYT